jgi:hypothetical protein
MEIFQEFESQIEALKGTVEKSVEVEDKEGLDISSVEVEVHSGNKLELTPVV